METKLVRNVSQTALVIPDVGVVEPNAVVTVPAEFNNSNFEPVKAEAPSKISNK